jgi:hypothetical protein
VLGEDGRLICSPSSLWQRRAPAAKRAIPE